MGKLKNIVISAIIALVLLGFIRTSADAVPVVSIDPSVAAGTVGNPLNFDVIVDDVLSTDGILFFGFNVNKPASWTNVAGYPVVGPGFLDVSGGIYPEVAGIAFPDPVFDGDGIGGGTVLLASLSYIPMQPGKYTYSISGNMRKEDQGLFLELNLNWTSISASSLVCVFPCIDVQGDPTSVPEPATISLLGFSLLTIAGVGYGFRRRAKKI